MNIMLDRTKDGQPAQGATSGTPPGGSNEGEPVNGHKEDSLQKALDEEAAIMNQLKVRKALTFFGFR